ncbi:helix-turn-helix domain-containing protein [Dermabacter hominis]|uniref:helix-turn-helix transcriptional regulator n=1 Tax=Dermabacter hominis TaxID=36740 RepID=UPI003183C16B
MSKATTPKNTTDPMPAFPQVLNTARAAELLGVQEATLRYWRHCGRGPKSYNVGRVVRYDLDTLRAWQDAQRANAVGDEL